MLAFARAFGWLKCTFHNAAPAEDEGALCYDAGGSCQLKGHNNARGLKRGILLLPHPYHSQFVNKVGMTCALKNRGKHPELRRVGEIEIRPRRATNLNCQRVRFLG